MHHWKTRTRTLLIALSVAALALGAGFACSVEDGGGTKNPTTSQNPASATMNFTGNAWSPKEVTIRPGGQVTFVNNSDVDMQIDFADNTGLADTAPVPPGGQETVQFANGGSYELKELNSGKPARVHAR